MAGRFIFKPQAIRYNALAMIDQQTMGKIRRRATAIDWRSAFAGKSEGNRHLYRMERIARALAATVSADPSVVVAGALLHDVALPTGNDYDYRRNKRVARQTLKPFRLDARTIARVAECVATHEGTAEPRTLEAQVVHDADVLEKSGLLGFIRHTWKLTNLGRLGERITRREELVVNQHLRWRGQQLRLPAARRLHRHLAAGLRDVPQGVLREVMQTTRDLSERGVVTERISATLMRHLPRPAAARLREQLSLSYLRYLPKKTAKRSRTLRTSG